VDAAEKYQEHSHQNNTPGKEEDVEAKCLIRDSLSMYGDKEENQGSSPLMIFIPTTTELTTPSRCLQHILWAYKNQR
jgi:hypothetical protein